MTKEFFIRLMCLERKIYYYLYVKKLSNSNYFKLLVYPDNSLMEKGGRRKENIFRRIIGFYWTGFKSMTVGKTLWIIILIKIFILFFVLRLFFFKNDLAPYKTPAEKSGHVIENLVEGVKTE